MKGSSLPYLPPLLPLSFSSFLSSVTRMTDLTTIEETTILVLETIYGSVSVRSLFFLFVFFFFPPPYGDVVAVFAKRGWKGNGARDRRSLLETGRISLPPSSPLLFSFKAILRRESRSDLGDFGKGKSV